MLYRAKGGPIKRKSAFQEQTRPIVAFRTKLTSGDVRFPVDTGGVTVIAVEGIHFRF